MDSSEIRQRFLSFFEKNKHKIMPSSSLLPADPSVLFTTAGMQQFKPYYLGEKSPFGPNVASCQKCIRTSDIDEVGDEKHLTFFEMLGNFSFGGYFKEEAIKLAYEFIVKELKLEIDYVTVFSPDKVGDADWRKGVLQDKESFKIWQDLGIKDIRKEGIDNFWGPTGDEGPCGPTTEIYVNGIEIWNIVFNEFLCNKNKKLGKLETPGVDTGMGLERLAMVVQKVPTVFETDLFDTILKKIGSDIQDIRGKRIVADHIRAATFLINDEVQPLNIERGYILRRLLRRAIYYYNSFGLKDRSVTELVDVIADIYEDTEYNLNQRTNNIKNIIAKEETTFLLTLEVGKKKLEEYIQKNRSNGISGEFAFTLYSTYGYPLELTVQLAQENGEKIDIDGFAKEFKEHQELSRTSSAGMFKGGLADDKPETIKLHTAHHLLLAALQDVFGKQVKQKGSNINSERLRIDFSFDRKLTDEEKKKIEDIVNQKIKDGLDVVKKEMLKEEAEKIGAEMEFGVKYGDRVSVYFIQDKNGNVFSKEFCGGPHVKNTSELGNFKIIKEESLGSGVRIIKATLKKIINYQFSIIKKRRQSRRS